MISYEELCAALDKLTAQRRNEAELAALEKGGEKEAAASPAARRKAITGALPQNLQPPTFRKEPEPIASDQEIDLDVVVEE